VQAESNLGADAATLSLDEKATWLEEQEKNLRWHSCMEPTLRKLFPLAEREQRVREHYHTLWEGLHKYVHPSRALASKLIGPASLLFCDGFDEEWARETADAGTQVFDLVWLAVLQAFPRAWDRLDGLSVEYPILKLSFDNAAAG
jgi:hypothetical protein